jgi:hypothetical protein
MSIATTTSTGNALCRMGSPAASVAANAKPSAVDVATCQPRSRATSTRPNQPAMPPTMIEPPSQVSVCDRVARLPAAPASPDRIAITKTSRLANRMPATSVASSRGGRVSASPSPAIVATSSAEVGCAGHGSRSASGAISAVIASPGTMIATDRLRIASRLPPSPTAISAPASVTSAAARTWVPLPAKRPSGPRSLAVSGVPVQGIMIQRYGPASAASSAGATKTTTMAAGAPAA